MGSLLARINTPRAMVRDLHPAPSQPQKWCTVVTVSPIEASKIMKGVQKFVEAAMLKRDDSYGGAASRKHRPARKRRTVVICHHWLLLTMQKVTTVLGCAPVFRPAITKTSLMGTPGSSATSANSLTVPYYTIIVTCTVLYYTTVYYTIILKCAV